MRRWYMRHSRHRTRVVWIKTRIGRAWDAKVGSLAFDEILPRHAVFVDRRKVCDKGSA